MTSAVPETFHQSLVWRTWMIFTSSPLSVQSQKTTSDWKALALISMKWIFASKMKTVCGSIFTCDTETRVLYKISVEMSDNQWGKQSNFINLLLFYYFSSKWWMVWLRRSVLKTSILKNFYFQQKLLCINSERRICHNSSRGETTLDWCWRRKPEGSTGVL